MSQGQLVVFLPDAVKSKISKIAADQLSQSLDIAAAANHEGAEGWYGELSGLNEELTFLMTMLAAQAFVQGFVADREQGFRAITLFQDAERTLTHSVQHKLKDEAEKIEQRKQSGYPGVDAMLDMSQRARAKQASIEHEEEKRKAVDFDPTTQDALLSLGLTHEDVLKLYDSFEARMHHEWPALESVLTKHLKEWIAQFLNDLYRQKARTEGVAFYEAKLLSLLTHHFRMIQKMHQDEAEAALAQTEVKTQPASEPEPAPAPAAAPNQVDAEARLAAQIEDDTDEDQKLFEKDLATLQKECGPAIFDTVTMLQKSLPDEFFKGDARKLANAVKGLLVATNPPVVEKIRELDFGRDAFVYVVEQSRDKILTPEASKSVTDAQEVAPRRNKVGRPRKERGQQGK